MTQYLRIAQLREEKDSYMELFEVGEYLNGDMDDYYIMWVNPAGYYLVKEDEDGDVDVGASFEEVGGDIFGATDEVAQKIEGTPYHIVEFPSGDLQLAYIGDE